MAVNGLVYTNNPKYDLSVMNHKYCISHTWQSQAGSFQDEPCNKKGLDKTQEYVSRLLRRHGKSKEDAERIIKSINQKNVSKTWKYTSEKDNNRYEITIKEIARGEKNA